MTSQLASSGDFNSIVANGAREFPYVACPDLWETDNLELSGTFYAISMHRRLALNLDWQAVDLLAFEGAEFAEAATQFLRGRASTPAEQARFAAERRPGAKLSFALDLDRLNRNDGSPVRLSGAGAARACWRLGRFFRKAGATPLRNLFQALFRANARRLASRGGPGSSQRVLLQVGAPQAGSSS